MNLAVNNLLSRDEDDGDDDENPEYLPGGEIVCIQLYSCGIINRFQNNFMQHLQLQGT